MAKHYEIDNEKKIIYADIMALTEKEEAEVAKFQKYGYDVENKVKEKAKISRLDDDYITKYLSGVENSEEELKTYKAIKKREAVDEEGHTKTYATGRVKEQGFNAGRNWFARKYPLDVNEAIEAIERAGKTKVLETAFKGYKKKAEKAKAEGKTVDAMTEDEYTRDFYWKKVFVKPKQSEE